MIEKTIEIVNELGLHARAAAKLVHLTGTFSSEVILANGADEVDGKSILGILLLAAPKGTTITVCCQGDDETEAMDSIAKLFADRFGEAQ